LFFFFFLDKISILFEKYSYINAQISTSKTLLLKPSNFRHFVELIFFLRIMRMDIVSASADRLRGKE